MFKNRLIEPELLDHAEPEEARLNLADLVRINKRFGGYSTAAKLLSQVAQSGDEFTLLDVGAASGDTGRYLADCYPRAKITSLDYNEVNAGAAAYPKVIADAFALPFPGQSFDFVFCSLFLHHFTDAQVIQLLSGFSAVAKEAVLVTDLERHPLAYWFLPATRPFLKWSRITVHDGRISVRAAFRRCELERLAYAAGMRKVSVEVHRPAFRLSLVGRK
jgi:2-polyprenyl-3-methyl-5-hydroxy-6-metoxy-1,4-benzoquinol methylase